MEDNNTIAIVEAEIDKKMLDVIDCSNKVKAIFNKIEYIVSANSNIGFMCAELS